MAAARANQAESVGERLAGVEARLEAFDRYTHERWHGLNNDLQVLLALPERLTREVGKLQGIIDGRIASVSKDVERSMEAAISKALKPVTDDVTELKAEVEGLRKEIEALKTSKQQWTGARIAVTLIVQTVIAAVAATAAVLSIHTGRVFPHA
jgi:predicted RNase H-like nuclease (RuvC/YqgF family)